MIPVIGAIWFVPWFVTQDGPLHIYNAHISAELSRGNPFFENVYTQRSGLLPYSGAYRIMAWLMSILSARAVDRLMMAITSLGFACSVLWLRWRVAGWQGMPTMMLLALLLSISRLWLYGLYPFLLGACLFPVTLGLWWKWRDELKPARAAALALLLVLGYFFHIVSTGFTVLGLILLAVATPGSNLKKRWAWTAASLAPVAYLIFQFRSLMSDAGESGFGWNNLEDGWSLGNWIQYLQIPDFISISFKTNAGVLAIPTDCPFVEEPSTQFAILSPSLWAIIAVALLMASTLSGKSDRAEFLRGKYRGWAILILCLFAIGLFGPSTIGKGSLLRERVLLLALVSLVPVLRFDIKESKAKFALVFLALALTLQTAFIWDYALISNRIAGEFMETQPYIGSGQRVAVVIPDIRTHYLINPHPNIANQLGVASDNVVWNNYGPNYYYFPVAFRDEGRNDCAKNINHINELFFSASAQDVATKNPQRWASDFGSALDQTDLLVVCGAAPWFDSLNAKMYHSELIFERGSLRIFKHK
jgi:hypothetical protein